MDIATVGDVMIKDVVTVEGGASVQEAARKMVNNKIGSVIVVKDGVPVGIITKLDIVTRAVKKGDVTMPVEDIMSSPILTIDKDKDLVEAGEMMNRMDVKRLLIMEGNRAAGIISMSDIIKKTSIYVSEFSKSFEKLDGVLSRL